MANFRAWRQLFLAGLRLVPLALLGFLLFLIASIFALFGNRELLDMMLPTLRRFYILPAKTAEEKHARAVTFVNWTYMRHGYGWFGIIWQLIWRATGRRMIGHFLEGKLEELRAAMGSQYIAHLAKMNDRDLIVSSTSLLDNFIGMMIIIRFPVSISKKDYERVFEGQGELSRFSSKIAMGKVLGLLIGDMPHDLTILRKIRNDFAHAIEPQSLSDALHSSRCRSLKMSGDLSDETIADCGTIERQRIVASVASNMMYMAIVLQRGIQERQFVQQHAAEINDATKEAMELVRKAQVVEPLT